MLVTFMVGIPGSGKTTWIRNNLLLVRVCSADNYFMRNGEYKFDIRQIGKAHAFCRDRFVEAYSSNALNVVVDNTNTSLKELGFYLNKCRYLEIKYRFVVLECSVETAFGRNIHGVPRATIEKMHARVENFKNLLLKDFSELTLVINTEE